MRFRIFVATREEFRWFVVSQLEGWEYEVIPLTNDSIVCNINNLHTCNLILVDSSTPLWVLRESESTFKTVVAFISMIEDRRILTGFISKPDDLKEALSDLGPFLPNIVMINEEYVEKLARFKLKYSVGFHES